MGKRKRGHPDVEEILHRPWCYYCERDFEDLKLLISHQKAKHFKCERCGRRLNTAGGLSVHMNQVHKENLTQVENALANRQGLEVEIFGMEGIPQDILDQHRNRIIQNFYQAQEDRRIATGNPLPGQDMKNNRKKVMVESQEELKKRFGKFREQGKKAAANGGAEVVVPQPPPANAPVYNYEQQPNYPAQPAPYQYTTTTNLPPRPSGNLAAPPGLPQRPTQAGGWENNAPAATDDIDRLIRMAEAGIKAPAEEGEKKGKKDKDKKARMFYDDTDVSPEERMAGLSRYRWTPEVAAA